MRCWGKRGKDEYGEGGIRRSGKGATGDSPVFGARLIGGRRWPLEYAHLETRAEALHTRGGVKGKPGEVGGEVGEMFFGRRQKGGLFSSPLGHVVRNSRKKSGEARRGTDECPTFPFWPRNGRSRGFRGYRSRRARTLASRLSKIVWAAPCRTVVRARRSTNECARSLPVWSQPRSVSKDPPALQ